MLKRYQISTPAAPEAAPWAKAAQRSWPAIRTKVVSEAFFDQVVKLRDEARKAKK